MLEHFGYKCTEPLNELPVLHKCHCNCEGIRQGDEYYDLSKIGLGLVCEYCIHDIPISDILDAIDCNYTLTA